MTREEAAEEVLRGPYCTCWTCKGSGEQAAPVPDGMLGGTLGDCKSCKGSGIWRREAYLRACLVLNIEPVDIPKRKTVDVEFPSLPVAAQVMQNWSQAMAKEQQVFGRSAGKSLLNLQKVAERYGIKCDYKTIEQKNLNLAEAYGWNSAKLDKLDRENRFKKEYFGMWSDSDQNETVDVSHHADTVNALAYAMSDDTRRSSGSHSEGHEERPLPEVSGEQDQRTLRYERELRRLQSMGRSPTARVRRRL